MRLWPRSRPKQTLDDTLKLLKARNVTEPVALVGIRGYYKNSMGRPRVNDRGIYDDAIFLVAPDVYVAFNASADPVGYRKGRGTGARKGMARLKAGLYRAHNIGLHKGEYKALVQRSGEVTVIRDGIDGDYEDTGYFGINIHRGGVNSVSSIGCQTIPPAQWNGFIELVEAQMKLHGQKVIPYLLVEA